MEELSQLPPDRMEGDGLLLRRWRLDDAKDLGRAVAASQEHLRPWMPWIAGEPKTLDQCRARIPEWDHEWAKGRDFVLGVFVGERVASRKLVDRFDGNIAAQRLPTLPLDDERGTDDC